MKKFILLVFVLSILFVTSGCGDPFTGGLTTGLALSEIADKAQDDFIIAINELNAETKRMNDAQDQIVIRKETIDAVTRLKGREKDWMTWLALASSSGLLVWLGRALKGIKS